MTSRATFSNLVERLPLILDRDFGLITELEEVRIESGAPNFFHYRAAAAKTEAFAREQNFKDSGGASTSRDAAMAKAIGEALERYCPALFDFEELPLCSWADAPAPALEPEAWALYSDDQYNEPGFPWARFERSTQVRWMTSTDILTGEELLVPACRVFMPYNYYIGTGDTPIDQPISTGLACHKSYEKAATVGLCEVIERDSVMLAWQARISPAQVRVESLPDEIYDLVTRFEVAGLRIDIFDITTDNRVPTILCTARGREKESQPALVVAASSSLDPVEAARKSLEELAHTRRYCQWVKTNLPRLEVDPPEYDVVVDQLTHLSFYVDDANLHHAEFLFAGKKRKDFDEIEDLSTGSDALDLECISKCIQATGERVLVTELTSPDVASLGLSVVRAMVPGYQPLHMGFRLRSRGGRRLYEVPQLLGHPGLSPGESDNPSPHPYP